MSQTLALERGLNLGKSGQLALEPESRLAVNAKRHKSGRGLSCSLSLRLKSQVFAAGMDFFQGYKPFFQIGKVGMGRSQS